MPKGLQIVGGESRGGGTAAIAIMAVDGPIVVWWGRGAG